MSQQHNVHRIGNIAVIGVGGVGGVGGYFGGKLCKLLERTRAASFLFWRAARTSAPFSKTACSCVPTTAT